MFYAEALDEAQRRQGSRLGVDEYTGPFYAQAVYVERDRDMDSAAVRWWIWDEETLHHRGPDRRFANCVLTLHSKDQGTATIVEWEGDLFLFVSERGPEELEQL